MRTFFYSILALTSLILASCNASATAKNLDEAIDQIERLEAEMKTKNSLDTALANRTQLAYMAFINDYPQDSLVPFLIKKQGDLYAAWPGHSTQAIAAYQTLVEDYQEHPVSPYALMGASFVYEAQKDQVRQAAAYRMFLNLYPKHPLASDAKNLLAMVTSKEKTDLDQIKAWQKATKKDTLKK